MPATTKTPTVRSRRPSVPLAPAGASPGHPRTDSRGTMAAPDPTLIVIAVVILLITVGALLASWPTVSQDEDLDDDTPGPEGGKASAEQAVGGDSEE